jgi:ribose transport system permease protein
MADVITSYCPRSPVPELPRRRLTMHLWGPTAALAAGWLALVAASGIHRPDFLSHQTMLAVAFTMAIVGVLAVGQALVSISGGFLDLSQPAALALSAYLVSQTLAAGLGTLLGIVVAIAAGATWGLLNALIIVHGRLNPVIVTLSTNFVGVAVLFLTFQIAQAPINSAIRLFGRTAFLGFPSIWWPMVGLVLLAGFFLPRTRAGRHAIAVGGNRFAAQVRGISLRRTRIAIFTLSGACGGLAGLLFTASSGPFTPTAGAAFQLPVIASVILAGISLAGGRGNIWIILLSVGFLSTIPTSLVFFGLSSDWQSVFQGLVLMLAVAVDGYANRRSAR